MSGIVEVAETQVSECSTVRLQFIRHNLEWPNALVPEELSHEFQCRPLVSALLNQDVEWALSCMDMGSSRGAVPWHLNGGSGAGDRRG